VRDSHWNVEGKTLTLSFGGSDRSSPFTFYESQLVFPNIPESLHVLGKRSNKGFSFPCRTIATMMSIS
jgi:hypothetical protein